VAAAAIAGLLEVSTLDTEGEALAIGSLHSFGWGLGPLRRMRRWRGPLVAANGEKDDHEVRFGLMVDLGAKRVDGLGNVFLIDQLNEAQILFSKDMDKAAPSIGVIDRLTGELYLTVADVNGIHEFQGTCSLAPRRF
jgi:hypothetical protein